MNRIKLHINLLIKNSLYGLFVLIALPLWSQSSLDWSYDYSLAETNMTIGISEMVIDEITVEGNTFPVGSVLGVFYQNNIGEFICAGSVIWDYQANMLPVWSSDELLQGQEWDTVTWDNVKNIIPKKEEIEVIPFNRELISARQKAQYTPNKLAQALNIKLKDLESFENGTKLPENNILYKINKLLSCKLKIN